MEENRVIRKKSPSRFFFFEQFVSRNLPKFSRSRLT